MATVTFELSRNHWVLENFKETCSGREWREYLQTHERTLFFRGHLYEFICHSVGSGTVEISKRRATPSHT